MARNVAAACVAAVALAAVSGCGTVMNLTHEPSEFTDPKRPYGGVLVDCVGTLLWIGHPDLIPVSLGAVLDFPLTVVGDTLALPYVIYLNVHKDDPADPSPKAAPVEQAKYADPSAKPVP